MATDWITTNEAAKLSGYHPNHVRRLIRTEQLEAQKFSQVWQVSRSSVLAYIRKTGKLGARRGPKPA